MGSEKKAAMGNVMLSLYFNLASNLVFVEVVVQTHWGQMLLLALTHYAYLSL